MKYFSLEGLLVGIPPCLRTTGLSLARAKLAKKARFHWVPLRAGPAGVSKHQKNSKIILGLVFRPFPGEVFELRFGLEKV
jgi:hypothetical protein